MVIVVTMVAKNPASVDPERAWLREERRGWRGERPLKATVLQSIANRDVHRRPVLKWTVVSGIALQVTGALSLLAVLELPVNLSSILALGAMLAGELFIVTAINGRHERRPEACLDRRYH